MGKIGRSSTATDPAPLTMIETTIQLERDKNKWRQVPDTTFFGLIGTTRPITLEELTDGYTLPNGSWVPGINEVLQIPGLTGALTRGAMPIRTRIDMLATGIRTPVGVKFMGDDLNVLNALADDAVAILQSDAAVAKLTKSVSSERLGGGRYVDIIPHRQAIARHGASIDDVTTTIASALGGVDITMTTEGRERYGVNVRYAPELRDNIEALENILISTPHGAHIPLAELATIEERFGPAMIRSENARLSSWIFVTPEGSDIGGYVAAARTALEQQLDMPAGYSLVFSGSYEYQQEAAEKMAVAIPLTLLVIIVLLYLHTRSWLKTALVVVCLSFSVIGAVWMVFILGFPWSLAVTVGVIALLGLDAETSLVMLHYQDASIARYRREGRLTSRAAVWEAIHDGAVQRIRPKTMTVITTFVGLLPLMWASGAGADTMQRLAAPMIGGLGTSFIMELVVFPAVYYLVMRNRYKST